MTGLACWQNQVDGEVGDAVGGGLLSSHRGPPQRDGPPLARLMWAEGWEVLGRGTPVLRQWRRAGGGGSDPDRKPSARTSQERLCRMPLGAEGEAGKQLLSLHFLYLRFLALAQSPAEEVTSIGFSKSEVLGVTVLLV